MREAVENHAETANLLTARRMGIDTQHEAVVFMRKDCHVCRSEGFTAHTRIRLSHGGHSIIATLHQVTNDLLAHGEAGLSESAWHRLQLDDGDRVSVNHPSPLSSLGLVRGKVYGQPLDLDAFRQIVTDVTAGRYSDIHLASFLTACAARPLDMAEIPALTKAMVEAGVTLDWGTTPVVDKHCVGGLPGNRTTPIVVAIAAASGLTDAQDVLARYYVAGRHRRYDGDAGAGRPRHCLHAPGRGARRGMRCVGRRGAPEPGR